MTDNLENEFTSTDPIESYDGDLPKGDDADKNSQVRKRIDDLLERKRLKELLDDTDDWAV